MGLAAGILTLEFLQPGQTGENPACRCTLRPKPVGSGGITGFRTNMADGSSEERDSRFIVHSRREIAAIFKSVMAERQMVTAQPGHGHALFVTRLLAADAASNVCVVDAARDPGRNDALVAANNVVFVSRQGRLRVHWTAARLWLAPLGDGPALHFSYPEHVFRFQRREFFRVQPTDAEPATCSFVLAGRGHLPVELVDISIGGVGLAGLPSELDLSPGSRVDMCTLVLPSIGTIGVSLTVRSVEDIEEPGRGVRRRVGCGFVGLPPRYEVALQRYIMRLERMGKV
jgi:c-di-GMP-binding flagellar brake protein YcgR